MRELLRLLLIWRLAAVFFLRCHGCLAWLVVVVLSAGATAHLDQPFFAVVTIPFVCHAWLEAEIARGYHVRPTWVDRMLGIGGAYALGPLRGLPMAEIAAHGVLRTIPGRMAFTSGRNQPMECRGPH